MPLPYGDADRLVAVWEHHVVRNDAYRRVVAAQLPSTSASAAARWRGSQASVTAA